MPELTVKDAVEKIHRKNYLLPAIQREFVWNEQQIGRFFDSIMRGYPIGSFLFWVVDDENKQKYQFYTFPEKYYPKGDTTYTLANTTGDRAITAILDGQQRLSSLYIGLKGSYAPKLKKKQGDKKNSSSEKHLCLNLLADPEDRDDEDLKYDFSFLNDTKLKKQSEEEFWFKVGDILDFTSVGDVLKYLKTKKIPDDKHEIAAERLSTLFEAIHIKKPIYSFEEEDEELDNVLNMFVRINSGGTHLGYSDLLLSIATAQWRSNNSARESINQLVGNINSMGDGFNVKKDTILKSCLVLADTIDIGFKVKNFTKDNMRLIEKKWEDISESVESTFSLIHSRGYSGEKLATYNALIPIAYYLHKIGNPPRFETNSKYQNDREKIFRFLVLVILKQAFSGSSDTVLRQMQEVIRLHHKEGFPLNEIIFKFQKESRPIKIDDDDIDSFLELKYGKSYTYTALSFLYPWLDFRNKFHQDHIFPKSLFKKNYLQGVGLNDEDINFYMKKRDCLANLQLLEGPINEDKRDQDFNHWLNEKYQKGKVRDAYMGKHYIPDVDLSLNNFRQFIEKREELLKEQFKELCL